MPKGLQQLFGGDPHGALLFIVIVSLPVSVAASLFLLALYRRAVEKAMHAPAEGGVPPVLAAVAPQRRPASLPQLTFDVVEPSTVPGKLAKAEPTAERSPRPARALARRAAAVYAIAGAAHAAISVVVVFVARDKAFLPIRTLFVWFILAWPIVPTVMMVAISDRRMRAAGVGLYFLIAVLISPVSLPELITLWGWFVGVPTALMLAVSFRRLRAVGPMVLTAVLVIMIGLNISFLGLRRVVRRNRRPCIPLAVRWTGFDYPGRLRLAGREGISADHRTLSAEAHQ